MTDSEADAWFLSYGHFEAETKIGYTTYGLKRKGGAIGERVGFVKPDDLPHPEETDVRRFLSKWFVSAYGA